MTYLYRRLQFKYLFQRYDERNRQNEVDRPKERLERNTINVVGPERRILLTEAGDIEIIHDHGIDVCTDDPDQNERKNCPERKEFY